MNIAVCDDEPVFLKDIGEKLRSSGFADNSYFSEYIGKKFQKLHGAVPMGCSVYLAADRNQNLIENQEVGKEQETDEEQKTE